MNHEDTSRPRGSITSSHHRARWLAAVLAGVLAGAAWGATFRVDKLGDFSDDTPGDGICETVNGNPIDGFTFDCSLRGAIEEANANPGTDTIEFALAGTITPASGPLPTITGAVVIDGSTAPGAPARDRELVLEPTAPAPVVFIDGSALGGTPNGLHLLGTSAGSEVYNLGIINFGGSGIRVVGGGAETVISGNWIGQMADRSAAPNGTGIDAGAVGTVNVRVGHDGTSLAGTGRGNVISGNSGGGLIGTVSGLTARGNWIGSAGDGAPDSGGSATPNGGSGVSLTGTGNRLLENFIVGNGHPQVRLSGANSEIISNDIFGVTIDPGLLDPGSVVPGSSDGLHALGPNALIDGNSVWANQVGIRLASSTGGVPNVGATLTANTAALNALDGIVLAGVEQVTMDENDMVLNGAYGARIETDSNLIRGNVFGRVISETEDIGNDSGGLLITGDNNDLVALPGGLDDKQNLISANGGPGILLLGDGTLIDGNGVSLNAGAGLVVDGALATVVTGNTIGLNAKAPGGDGNGIVLGPGTAGTSIEGNGFFANKGAAVSLDALAGEGNRIESNFYLANAGISIDLGADGETANDPGDGDAGVNRLQNTPVIGNLSFDDVADPPTVNFDVMVDTSGANSALPLTIEIYGAEGGFERGGVPVRSVSDPNPPAVMNLTLDLASGTAGGALRAIAIDADGNTSEFSPAIEFGEIDDSLFIDGFEDPPEPPCEPFCPIGDPDCIMCPP